MITRCILAGLHAAFAVTLAAGLSGAAQAGMDVPTVELGRALASERCGACHAIAPGDLSPNPEAPPFADVAGFYPPESLEEALAEGIMVGHEAMPAFEFTPEEVEQLIAYLRSLE